MVLYFFIRDGVMESYVCHLQTDLHSLSHITAFMNGIDWFVLVSKSELKCNFTVLKKISKNKQE